MLRLIGLVDSERSGDVSRLSSSIPMPVPVPVFAGFVARWFLAGLATGADRIRKHCDVTPAMDDEGLTNCRNGTAFGPVWNESTPYP